MLVNLYNPYTHRLSNFMIDLDNIVIKRSYIIKNTTPFSEWYLEWSVFITNDDHMIYVPGNNNTSQYVYIIDARYVYGAIKYPYGIYAISIADFYGV